MEYVQYTCSIPGAAYVSTTNTQQHLCCINLRYVYAFTKTKSSPVNTLFDQQKRLQEQRY